jgi:hypothetical protein
LGVFGKAWEVEELCFDLMVSSTVFYWFHDVIFATRSRTTLRRCAGEQAISVVLVIKTMVAIVVSGLQLLRY